MKKVLLSAVLTCVFVVASVSSKAASVNNTSASYLPMKVKDVIWPPKEYWALFVINPIVAQHYLYNWCFTRRVEITQLPSICPYTPEELAEVNVDEIDY